MVGRSKIMNREPIEIRFVLDAPHTNYQRDINTLILRIDKLVKFYDNISNEIPQSNIDVDINNKNVECIQEILEHFKI